MLKSQGPRRARLVYSANGFRVVSAGEVVECAESGALIPLAELRYWDIVRQRPFASAEIATRALTRD